jgi:hypothetical protein
MTPEILQLQQERADAEAELSAALDLLSEAQKAIHKARAKKNKAQERLTVAYENYLNGMEARQ